MIMLVILGFGAIIAMEVPFMVMRGQKGEARAFWVLLALGFALTLAQVYQWPVPNPTPILDAIFRPISEMLGVK